MEGIIIYVLWGERTIMFTGELAPANTISVKCFRQGECLHNWTSKSQKFSLRIPICYRIVKGLLPRMFSICTVFTGQRTISLQSGNDLPQSGNDLPQSGNDLPPIRECSYICKPCVVPEQTVQTQTPCQQANFHDTVAWKTLTSTNHDHVAFCLFVRDITLEYFWRASAISSNFSWSLTCM